MTAAAERFSAYCRKKLADALRASMPGYLTIEDNGAGGGIAYGNAWSQSLFDGNFYRQAPRAEALPAVSLVFVQSRDGNTVAPNPAMLGGGCTDTHLIYEGLSRIDADAVMAGAATARGRELVFSVWHPELVDLRGSRGHPRHPAQVIVTDRGDLPFDRGLMFQLPELRVFVITRSASVAAIARALRDRPWVRIIDAGDPLSLDRGLRSLRADGIAVVSAVGGRQTATSLLRDGLVDDIYLTTSPIEAGEPHTPFYEGPPLPLRRVVLKAGRGSEEGVRFEHFVVDRGDSHKGHEDD